MLVKHKAYFKNIFVLLFLIPDPFVVSPYAYGFIFPVACKVAEVEWLVGPWACHASTQLGKAMVDYLAVADHNRTYPDWCPSM